ncbi:FAD/NAD(P)-binding protein [Teichococcus oryzae]|nr:FAD/NAD(P)-binding protein [Pseudoroseomonas oryzae]
MAPVPDLAIIGGGFAGTSLALQARLARPDWRVLLFEPAEPGPGLAYSTLEPGHLLNVPAAGMSLFPDRPAHFAEWLAARPDAPRAAPGEPVFAPRRLYGRYLSEQFRAAEGPMLRHVALPVSRLERTGGGFVLRAGEETWRAGRVALAVGGFAAPGGAPPPMFSNPWDPAALRGIDPDAPVLLLGLGLTAVDMLVSLREGGHRGPVLGLSRHGWLPLPHLPRAAPPVAVELPQGCGPLEALRRIRQAQREAAGQGQPWQAVMDGVRPQVQRLWQDWDLAARRRFLRHGRSAWNLHRHRVAPSIGAFLAKQRATGGLEVVAGRLLSWRTAASGAEVVIGRRGGGELRREVGRIIQCIGPDGASAWRQGAPVAGLMERGVVEVEPLGLGLRVAPSGQIADAAGSVVPGLAAIGPLTRGMLWEITAVPEIRAQAAAALAGPLAEPIDPDEEW